MRWEEGREREGEREIEEDREGRRREMEVLRVTRLPRGFNLVVSSCTKD